MGGGAFDTVDMVRSLGARVVVGKKSLRDLSAADGAEARFSGDYVPVRTGL